MALEISEFEATIKSIMLPPVVKGGVRASGFGASINYVESIRAMWAEEGVQVASGLVTVLGSKVS